MMAVGDRVVVDVLQLHLSLGVVRLLDVLMDEEVGEEAHHDNHINPEQKLSPNWKRALAFRALV
jgi:hypothetical protein